jgi:hypothetical protein
MVFQSSQGYCFWADLGKSIALLMVDNMPSDGLKAL